jgi:putative ABC transport system permease protein
MSVSASAASCDRLPTYLVSEAEFELACSFSEDSKVHLGQLMLRNAARSPLRTSMTVLTVAIMLTAFVFPRTLVEAQRQQVRETPNDRVLVLPRRGWRGGLPRRYVDEVRATEGVRQALGSRWAGLKLPGKEELFFQSQALDVEPFIAMHHELVAPEAQKQAFVADQASMFVGIELAREQGWKVGDRLVFQSRAFPGEWALTVAGIYESVRGEWAKRSLWMHYDQLNRAVPLDERDKVQFITAQLIEPNEGGRIAKALDVHFDASPVRTLTMEDRVLTAANVGRIGAVLTALDFVSYLILLVVLAILTNTLTLNVRERTREFGVLRAIGFAPKHLYLLVLGEAAVLGLAGALLGLALAYPLLEGLIGPYLQEALNFPATKVHWQVALGAAVAGVTLAMLAAALPAARLGRIEVREALGRVA